MKNVVIPKMGMGTTEVEIMSWKVRVGDHVREEDPLVEIESEKTSIEIASDVNGVVVEILYKEGEDVPVGSVICRIDVD
jgi:pyruvate/2-oxoglutarate dehydrogenase complex dihydrolipoamide acyltransferase (E2) component